MEIYVLTTSPGVGTSRILEESGVDPKRANRSIKHWGINKVFFALLPKEAEAIKKSGHDIEPMTADDDPDGSISRYIRGEED